MPHQRPQPHEYHPFYDTYVSLVGPDPVLHTLESSGVRTRALLGRVPDDQADHTYAPGKWTVRQVVRHVIDTERVFAARALRAARHDRTPLPGFDQDAWMNAADDAHVPLSALSEEFSAVRASTLALLRHLPPTGWDRAAHANGADVTVRALAYMIAGHELHHVRGLQERYGLR
ncbi:DinB family protein [Deinococcus maricopensis]|uniref:DinB-like domain-containing protein n=1 Tax=Deinococcus maricopensis (strain DSM 21211 / LMG 22137 / NRRL B-23946 / LB-34) TaxID=709986 RepID=E8U7H4_DEIML|nr:DinB family protein [Deinococcus maricopensis]ADV67013.1 hypothetical protein Deima_1363 [Deinococcus maricopensis DSM 21211]